MGRLTIPADGCAKSIYKTVTEYCDAGEVEEKLLSGAIQKCDQIDSSIAVYKKEGTRDIVNGFVFYKMERKYWKKGKYGRVYGGLLCLSSLPKGVRPARLTGGPFYELDIKNSCFSVRYVELLSIFPRKEVGGRSPCLASYVINREIWARAISEYYDCPAPDAEKLMISVLFRGPEAPRNPPGEIRLDSLPIVLSLGAECDRAMNFLLAENPLFSKLYEEARSVGGGNAKIRASALYLGEKERGYLSTIADFVSKTGNDVPSLIYDGLIYQNLTECPIAPSDVALDPFGVVQISSGPVGGETTCPVGTTKSPAQRPLWGILTEEAKREGDCPIVLSN